MGDIHVYEEHIEAVKLHLERIPFDFPQIKTKQRNNLQDYV
jgi:thymidylate synthase